MEKIKRRSLKLIKEYYKIMTLMISVCIIFIASLIIGYAYQGTIAESIVTTHITAGSNYPYVTSKAIVQSHTAVNGFSIAGTESTVPTGHLGALARVYNSNNSLIGQSNWYYNSSATTEWSVGVTTTPSTGSYYSQGLVAIFSDVEGDYATYQTARTPNVNY